MVDTVEITRVNIRDTLSLDVAVWMNHPDDWDFRPTLSCVGNDVFWAAYGVDPCGVLQIEGSVFSHGH